MIGKAGNEKPNEDERLAFTPTDNEKLIADAWWTAMEAGELPRPRGDGTQRQLFEAGYRAALAVFEKAHTPTDDEREAITDEALWDFAGDLLDAWNIEDLNPPSRFDAWRDRRRAARLRTLAHFCRGVATRAERLADALHPVTEQGENR